jgi:uncharacterized RDD family membrane protein YckC
MQTETLTLAPTYPGVYSRIKAVFTDYFVLLVLIIIATLLLSNFDDLPEYVNGLVFIFIFILYDPLFTSVFGGTLGHRLNGLRVRKASNPTQNISFFLALFRFLIKAFIGWLSLLTVMNNEKRKAIHDFASGSIVVYSDLK